MMVLTSLTYFFFGLFTQKFALDSSSTNAYNLINNSNWFYFSNLITISFLITIIVLLSICFSNTSSNVKLLNIISAYFLSVYLYTASLNFDLNLLVNNDLIINNQNLTFFFNLFIFIAIITTLIFFLSISNKFFIEENSKIEFSLLIWTILISAIFLISTTDFISIIILLECISFSSYVLVGFARKNKYSTSSALKYLIIAAIPGGLFILGISLFYFNFGSFSQDYLSLILNFDSIKISTFEKVTYLIENFYKESQDILAYIQQQSRLTLLMQDSIITLKDYSNNILGQASTQSFITLPDLLTYYNNLLLGYVSQLNEIMTYVSIVTINDCLSLETLQIYLEEMFWNDFNRLAEEGKNTWANTAVNIRTLKIEKEIIVSFLLNELVALQSLLQILHTLDCISLLNDPLIDFPSKTLTPAFIYYKTMIFETFPTIGAWFKYLIMIEKAHFEHITKCWIVPGSTIGEIRDYVTNLEKATLKTSFIAEISNDIVDKKSRIHNHLIEIHPLSEEKQTFYNQFNIGDLYYYLEACRLQIVWVLVQTMKTFAVLESLKMLFVIDVVRVGNTMEYLNTVYTHNFFINYTLGPNFLAKGIFNNIKYDPISINNSFININTSLKFQIISFLSENKLLYYSSSYFQLFYWQPISISEIWSFYYNLPEHFINDLFTVKIFSETPMISLSIYLAIILIISNLAFKLTAAPFHLWAPSVYGGSPLATLTYLSIFSKLTIVFFSIWLFSNTFDSLNDVWEPIFLTIAFLSIFFSILGAFSEKFFKRFFIYSSMGHVGFMLIGLAVLNLDGLKGTIDYLILYIISSFIVWFIIMHLTKKTMTLINLKGLAYNYPNLSMIFTMTLFSLSGIPPLGGFFVKYEIFYSIISSSFFWFGYILLLLTVISFFYYIRLIKIFYFENSKVYFINKNLDDLKLRLISLLFFIIPFFIFYADNAFSFILQNILQKSLF